MSISDFLFIANIQTGLAGIVVLMAFIPLRSRPVETRGIGLTALLLIVTMLALGVLDLKGMNVNIPQNVNTIIHYLILVYVYYVILGKRYRYLLLVTAICFVLFSVFNMVFWQRTNLNTYSLAIRALFMLTYCILYWYRLLVELPVQQLHRLPMFWYNAGLLIYNAATLFLFLFFSYFVDVLHNDMLIYWTFHNILSAIQFLVFMIGLWQDLRNIKSRSSLPSEL